ncbi:MAG: cysteine/glutathione ABC transporter ATP-binding protein/permease CydC [Desulfobacteraceae bacterium]|nr:cysteine/glutathione ABC transporter ATP-binding protein/permease CydC [Desulfobacteraceae bacterium]
MFKRWRELVPFIKQFRGHLKWMVLGTLSGLLAVASAVGLLALSGWFISAAAYAGLTAITAQLFNFFHPGIGVRIFAIGRTLARYVERIVSHDATFRILQSLRSWFYRHLEPLAPSRLMNFRSGDILNRIVADIDALDNLYLRVFSPSVIALTMSVLVVGFLWLFDPVISMVTALFLSMAGFWVPLMAMRLGEGCGHELAQHLSDLRIRIVEGLQGMPELLVFGAHNRHLDTVKQSSRALLKSQLRMSQILGLSQALLTLISGLAVLATLYLAVILVNRDVMDGPGMALVTLAVLASFEAVFPLPAAYQYLGRMREAGRRLLEIVDSKPEVIFPGRSVTRPRHFGLRFENVCFRYNQKAGWALRDVEFQVHPGRRVAVIGETGSGKSTLIHLLVRFRDPDAGCIQIGSVDVRNFGESDLRRHISVVTQQPHMFNATLRENLLMAQPGAGEDELLDALNFAQLLNFVSALPDGLDTWIGEAAKLLSGGQARRVAVARAMLHNGPLWVLDEPTEGLDPVTEERMMAAIKAQTAGRSLLLITHRLIDLHWMDDIVMLDKGRVVAQGTHEELLRGNTRYAFMHRRIA